MLPALCYYQPQLVLLLLLLCGLCRSLQVTRISIHKNLFISLFLFTVTTAVFRLHVLLPHLIAGDGDCEATDLSAMCEVSSCAAR